MGLLHRVFARSGVDVWDTENRLLHSFGLVRRPVAVQWLVTAACDMKCPHCYSAAGKRIAGELSTQEAKRLIIDELVALQCPLLVLSGGELLLRKDIGELVDYACSRGLDWAMHTHGMHVPRHREIFERHPPVLAAISLDGDRSFHDAFRGRAGSFEGALEAAKVLADAGCPEVVLGTTITRDNADRVADMFGLVASSRAHSWGLHLFAPEGRGHDHAELFPTPGQLRRVAAFARRRRGLFPIELCNEWGSAGDEDLYYRDQPFACGAGRISCVVSATGDVLPCTTTDPAEREGNVKEIRLRQLWAQSFGRFRSGSCLERGECWLQTRNGVRCAQHAFGPVSRTPPLWAERLPTRSRDAQRVASDRTFVAVRLLATGLVFLQACAKPSSEAPTTSEVHPERERPPSVDEPHWSAQPSQPDGFPRVLATDMLAHFAAQSGHSGWGAFRTALAECASKRENCDVARDLLDWAIGTGSPNGDTAARERGKTIFIGHIEALEHGREITFDEAIAVLDVVELHPTYDPWFAGHLWRAVRERKVSGGAPSAQRVRLFARLRQHHRVLDALKRAQASAGKVEVRPWLKKSAPPASAERIVVPAGLVDAARAAYPGATATTWETVAIDVVIRGDGFELARAGTIESLRAGASLRLGRLDVLWSPQPATLELSGGRAIEIPPGVEVTLFDLHEFQSDADRDALASRVTRAAKTGEVGALEEDLPLAHARVRRQLEADPKALGAPALRTLLVSFDE